MSIHVNELNSVALAYVGDAVFELHVRHYLIRSGQVNPHKIHGRAVQFVSAKAQAKIIKDWLHRGILTEEEQGVVRRGRNAKTSTVPKNTTVQAYRYATGFEALLGYLYLQHLVERLNELMDEAIDYIERNN